jgi:class 3 adenylate cyclase
LHQFDIIVEDIKILSDGRLTVLLADFRSLAWALTGLAINSNTVWPYFTDPNYHMIVSNFMNTTGTHMVAISPIVHNETESENWANYSQSKQGWIKDGLAFQQKPVPDEMEEIFPSIFRVSAGEKVPEVGPGPFLPVWQMIETPQDSSVFNFNLLSDQHYAEVFAAVLQNRIATMTDLLDTSLLDFNDLLGHHHDSPFSMLLYPIFRDVTRKEIVAILNTDVNWVPLFALASDEQTPPVDVVVDEGCRRKFTVRVHGARSHFMGYGDLHDSTYDEYESVFKFSSHLPTHHIAGPNCSYDVRVFPTQDFWETYNTSHPGSTAGVIIAVFVFTCIIFCLYDAAVHERQRKILRVAAQSHKILSILYPKTIRDRLFGAEPQGEETNNGKSKKGKIRRKLNEDILKKATKYQLKHFMKDSPITESNAMEYFDSKPIADLFLHATVLFADISGFTAWSSVREPTQVFILLETVYRAFDVIAKRRKVFKVETIGDCYVAVTGLPEPRKDHAAVMAGFARECVVRFGELAGALETTLGPDTGDLGIRVGLHSGPVTAGVLRGEKSRFQLFGDTVNTAARIEATGRRNKIHLSEETADLLTVAGKAHWLRRREQLVTAKGKGKLQTYWLMTKEEGRWEAAVDYGCNRDVLESKSSEVNALPNEITQASLNLRTSSYTDIEALLSPKMRRLCEWNVDVLVRVLKRIVAHRNASSIHFNNCDEELTTREAEIRSRFIVLDELVEILPLPGFDQRVYKILQNPKEIVLPEAVVEQIRLYVACIAAMYRDNPFHNFEHASHVTMSVSKLLSRIVAADDILNADENAAKSHDFGWSIHDHTYGITSDPITQFSVILAALAHDVDHSGVSNFQLIKEHHKLASLFKNKSVAEQNSTVLAWDTLMDPRFHDFRRTIYAAPSELERFRQLMANTVLATDIFDKQLQTLRRNRWDVAFSHSKNTKDNINRKATIVIEHLIQASDVAHTMQHWHIYQKWNERLFHEMAVAYKAGRMENNPADMWYKGEMGFFDNYIIPLAKKLKDCGVFGVASDEYLNYAMENRREWEEKGEAFVAEMVRRFIDHPDEDTEKLVSEHRLNPKRISLDLTSPHFQHLSPKQKRDALQWERAPSARELLGLGDVAD